jgi:ATP-dependent Clp protease adaptor protein ClpS
VAATETQTKPQTRDQPDVEQPKQWNVVLIDDQHHSYEYVVRMMQTLFSHNFEKAFKIACAVDGEGRAVCLTTHKEHAELKRDQILGFGADALIAGCQGSMTAVIEPAEFEGDEDDTDKTT